MMSFSIAMILASGCANKDQAKNIPVDQVKKYDVIRVSASTVVSRPDIFELAEELGYFAEERITLERVGAIPSTQALASVVAGKIDVGAGHINTTIAAISAGAPVRAVAAGTETTQEIPHMVYVTLANNPINNAQDLVGKRMGIPSFGACNEYTPYAFMKKNGITSPKNKVEVTAMSETLLEQALRQGEVDIIGVHQNPKFLLARGGLKVVFTDYDTFGSIGGATPFYFSENFIREKPDVVRRFVSVVAKTNNWADANQQQAIDIMVKRLKLDPTLLRTGYFAPDGKIKEETVSVWIDLLKDFGEIKGDIRLDQIYTNEFNPMLN
jgi:ABC-type nitrate/sulfonate/bicarbonate transport system substrate-binding protein